MAQTQLIKRRIRSVSNTRQITKAMELVSGSKLRRATEATIHSAAYTNSAREILGRLSQLTDAAAHPLFQQRSEDRRLIIVFTSDITLAGAYNSNVFRSLVETVKSAGSVKLIMIGNQGIRFASRLEDVELIGVYNNWPTEPTSADTRPIVGTAIKLFVAKEIDVVDIIYTKFNSSISQTAVAERLLPAKANGSVEVSSSLADAVFEPSPADVLTAMMPRLIDAQLLGAALNATASEHSMRMMAMKNASDNAGEIIDDLTLEYNGARQAGITQELAEITGGAEAIT